MSWTDERIVLLRKLWGEGKTAAEIASALGGVTRNAVIGKAHRLKLSNRVSPIQQNNKKLLPKAAPASEKKVVIPVMREEKKDTLPLMDVNGRMCRWPIGDPQEEGFGFCGDEAVHGLPYCPPHSKAAYQAAGRGRALKAEEFDDKPAVPEAEEAEFKQVSKP